VLVQIRLCLRRREGPFEQMEWATYTIGVGYPHLEALLFAQI
jgi:hypothetical protein